MFSKKEYKKLARLMDNLYICSGIKFALVGDDIKEYYTAAYRTDFCRHIQDTPEGYARCVSCDQFAINKMRKTKKAVVYKCHAGLSEVALPVISEGKIVSTILFGQILDDGSREEQWKETKERCAWYANIDSLKAAFMRLKSVDKNQIQAYSDIVESCISEVRLSNIVEGMQGDDYTKLASFIASHYAREDILKLACESLNMSKSKIYKMCNERYNKSFGKVVLDKRMEEAAYLIRTSDMHFYYIAEIVGIHDFNYFTKLFKNHYGKSPRQYKKEYVFSTHSQ